MHELGFHTNLLFLLCLRSLEWDSHVSENSL